jgi:PKHD-type hydroxylase
MNLDSYYYIFEEALTEKFCDDLIRYGEEQTQEIALTGNFDGSPSKITNEKDIAKLYKTRNSSIIWMNEPWIYRQIHPYINEANKICNWNFDWEFSESAQWTKYSKSQHYTWHQDAFSKPYNRPRSPDHGLVRKLSVTVSLEDGDEYQGGDLEFSIEGDRYSTNRIITAKEARKKGTITIFPSFVWHRVTPVTQGTRYSLVIWNLGFPFK